MGGSKEKTTQKIPAWAETAFKNQLERADIIAQQGYVPYQGPEVAAFTPQQTNAMQSAANWSAAFGGPGAQALDVKSTIPQAQQWNDGTVGYSSYPGYLDQLAAFKSAYPGQFKYIESLAIDPQTGAKNKPGQVSGAKNSFWDFFGGDSGRGDSTTPKTELSRTAWKKLPSSQRNGYFEYGGQYYSKDNYSDWYNQHFGTGA